MSRILLVGLITLPLIAMLSVTTQRIFADTDAKATSTKTGVKAMVDQSGQAASW